MAEQKATAKTSVLYEETRVFEPSKELVENSNVMKWMKEKGFKTEREMRLWCSANYIQFWGEMAKTYADWFEPWGSTLEWIPPYAKWFVGGKCNVTYNSVDRHALGAKKDKVAYIFVPEPTDQPTQKITYGRALQGGQQVRQRPEEPGRAEGRQSHVVHAHDPPTAHCHARHRQDRCYSLHCFLRIFFGRP